MPRVKQFNENEVLTRAMNLFWRNGYSATSVEDLVQHLGINRASLYSTFGDKENLFKKSLALYRENNTAGLKEFFKSEPNVKEGFLKLFQMSIEESVQDKDQKGCFVVNTTTELIPGDETINAALEENKRIFTSLFLEYLKSGELQDQIRKGKDLQSIATLLFIIYNGLKVVSKIKPDKEELNASIEEALKLLD